MDRCNCGDLADVDFDVVLEACARAESRCHLRSRIAGERACDRDTPDGHREQFRGRGTVCRLRLIETARGIGGHRRQDFLYVEALRGPSDFIEMDH